MLQSKEKANGAHKQEQTTKCVTLHIIKYHEGRTVVDLQLLSHYHVVSWDAISQGRRSYFHLDGDSKRQPLQGTSHSSRPAKPTAAAREMDVLWLMGCAVANSVVRRQGEGPSKNSCLPSNSCAAFGLVAPLEYSRILVQYSVSSRD